MKGIVGSSVGSRIGFLIMEDLRLAIVVRRRLWKMTKCMLLAGAISANWQCIRSDLIESEGVRRSVRGDRHRYHMQHEQVRSVRMKYLMSSSTDSYVESMYVRTVLVLVRKGRLRIGYCAVSVLDRSTHSRSRLQPGGRFGPTDAHCESLESRAGQLKKISVHASQGCVTPLRSTLPIGTDTVENLRPTKLNVVRFLRAIGND